MNTVYDFYYTFVIDCLSFDDLDDEIVEYLNEFNFKGFCYRKDERIRVVTIGMTRREVDKMKYKFRGYHVKQLHDLDIISDCLNPFLRFYGIYEKDYRKEKMK